MNSPFFPQSEIASPTRVISQISQLLETDLTHKPEVRPLDIIARNAGPAPQSLWVNVSHSGNQKVIALMAHVLHGQHLSSAPTYHPQHAPCRTAV